jgi:small subunit ribosomal protein S19e
MTTVFDVRADDLIKRVKEELKKVEQVRPVEWSKFVKTASIKSKPPVQDDFWYIRAASIMRQLYIRGRPIGVQRLRTKYGGKQQNKTKPAHFMKAGGSIIRKVMQQLEAAGLIQKATVNGKKGRILTKKGISYLDKIAAQIKKEKK